MHCPPGIFNSVGPHYSQWQVVGVFIHLAFCARKRHAVVSRNNYQRVFQFAQFFQLLQHALQVQIEVFNFESVVEHIGANGVHIGPERGDLVNFIQTFPSIFYSGFIFVSPVRFSTSVPKAERLAFGPRFQESLKVFCIIVIRYKFCRRFGFEFIKFWSGEFAPFPVDFTRIARGPAFCGAAHPVTVFCKCFGIRFKFCGEKRRVVGSLFQLPTVAPR